MLIRMSLRRSVPLLLALFAILYTLLVMTLYLPRSLNETQRLWRDRADQLFIVMRNGFSEHLRKGRTDEIRDRLDNLTSFNGIRWTGVLDEEGNMIAATASAEARAEQQRLAQDMLRQKQLANGQILWQETTSLHYLALYPLSTPDKPSRAVLMVALDLSPLLEQAKRNAWNYLTQTLAALLLLSLMLSKLYELLITRRLALIDQATRRFAEQQIPEPPIDRGLDEIGQLARTFSQMTQQLHDKQQALQESEHLMRDLIDTVPIGMLVVDRHMRIEQANSAVAALFACPASELHGNRLRDWLVEENAIRHMQQRPANTALELTGYCKGQQIPLEITCTPFQRKGQLFYLLLLKDISDRRQAEQQLRFLAHFDPLTRLANRHYLVQRLEQLLTLGSPLSLLYLDIDHFKRINDTLGHEIGDSLLVETANRLRQLCPAHSLLARSGGDEFMVLLEGAELDAALNVAEKLLAGLQQPMQIRQYECLAYPSIGITSSDGRLSANELLKQADLALYAAKDAGRNRLAIYDHSLSAAAEQRRQLEQELRRALDNQEFILHYQPQVDSQGVPQAMEALLRWQSPGRGLVPPDAFIPVLEDSGMIIETTRWVFREACRQVRRWTLEGYNIRIAVNLSSLDFRQADLAGSLLSILEDEQVRPEQMELEITESALLDTDSQVQDTLSRLKAAGILLLLDDFGTGYASLTYLQQFHFDGIKIDRQFVDGLPDSPQSLALVRGILTMASHLGLHVVAEGVENERQASFLRQHGCPSLQGYYFDRPRPAAHWSEHWPKNQALSP